MLSGALDDIVATIFQVVCGLFLARFILQASRADFYNPLSQGVVKATDPVLKPMRAILPGYKRFDTSAIVAAWIFKLISFALLDVIKWSQIVHPWSSLALGSLVALLELLLNMYLFAIIILVVQSWVAPGTYHPSALLLHQVTEPILAPARRIVPPVGGLDLSPIVVFLVFGLVDKLLQGIVLTLQL